MYCQMYECITLGSAENPVVYFSLFLFVYKFIIKELY